MRADLCRVCPHPNPNPLPEGEGESGVRPLAAGSVTCAVIQFVNLDASIADRDAIAVVSDRRP